MPKPAKPSPSPEEIEEFVEAGLWGEVRYARRSNGSLEAKEWIDAASVADVAKFSQLFRYISSEGQIRNKEQFRHLGDQIYEFKRNGNRIFCFQSEKCWFLTHHHKKSGLKCQRSEIDRAIQIRKECLAVLALRRNKS